MPRISYTLVDAFTEVVGGGNRVALVLDARGISTEDMHLIASKLGQPQAAFVTEWDGSGFGVRYFAANGELEYSGHASVALAQTLLAENKLPAGRTSYLRTIGETLSVQCDLDSTLVQCPSPRFRDPPPWRTLQAFSEVLGANERYLHRGMPYGVAFSGIWSLFMPVVAPGLVDDLEPDMDKLVELCEGLEVAAVHVYAPYGPRRFYARTFAPALGIPEDPVTGAANAALGALLARAGVVPRWEEQVQLTVTQGHRMGGPGQVEVQVEYGPAGNILGVYIGGKAVVAESGMLEFGPNPN